MRASSCGRSPELLVLPHRRERSTAAFFRGQPVMRLLRCCRCPVLVTRAARPAVRAWGDFLCGSVAHRVLSWGSSDVLIVPDAHVGAQAPITPERIGLPGAWAAMALAAGRGAP